MCCATVLPLPLPSHFSFTFHLSHTRSCAASAHSVFLQYRLYPTSSGTLLGDQHHEFSHVFCSCGAAVLRRPVPLQKLAPKVQIYTRDPGHYDKPNILICHVSGFYPPELELKLLRNGKEIHDANQTDLAFEEDWYYHLTQHAHFHPQHGDKYTCTVTHLGKTTTHDWDPDM